MNAQIRTLKADITADLNAIAEICAKLDGYRYELTTQDRLIAAAYYLHNLYCAFESIFGRVAEVFGNQLSDRAAGTPTCCGV